MGRAVSVAVIAFVGGAAACGTLVGGEGTNDPPVPPPSAVDGAVPPPVVDAGDAIAPPDAAPPIGCNGAVDCERVVFVTSAAYTGALLESAANANTKCNDLAKVSTAPRVQGHTFRAWLSDLTTSARDNLGVAGTKSYISTEGAQIANDFAGFASAAHLNAIATDENGNAVISGLVWTGTRVDGVDTGADCGSWSMGTQGTAGNDSAGTATTKEWSEDKLKSCTEDARLYCVEY